MRERQQELYEQAVSRLSQLLPGWSDAIASDPAVNVLELISYLGAVQETEIGHQREEHFLAYLKLLGESPRALAPAWLLAAPVSREGVYPGLRFLIDGVPFEVQNGGQYSGGQAASVVWERGGQRCALEPDAPLTLDGEAGAQLTVSFSPPLSGGVSVRLWCQLASELGRVPPAEDTPPPFKLLCTAECGGQWVEVAIADGTCGFLRSGYLTLTPPADTACLRFTWDGPGEGAPLLTALVPEPVRLEQRHTRSALTTLTAPYRLPPGWVGNRVLRFFLPEGDGWREAPGLFVRDGCVKGWENPPMSLRVAAAEPDFTPQYTLQGVAMEEIALEEEGVLPEALCLMAEENGIFFDCPVREPEAGVTLPRGCRWDGARHMLCFGDGRDFEPPEPGRLLVAGCVLTRGAAGNGAGGLLAQDGVLLVALQSAAGGQDAEKPKDAFDRVCQAREVPLRAVTCADYERLAHRTPGLALEQLRAMTNRALGRAGAGVTLYAKPRSTQSHPSLSVWQRERLTRWLEQFRLIGVPLRVEGPRYVPIAVAVSLSVSAPVAETAVRPVVLQLCDGVAGPLDFGAEIAYAALFSALGAVPGVRTVRTLELRACGPGAAPMQEGSLRLEPDCLPYLERLTITQE